MGMNATTITMVGRLGGDARTRMVQTSKGERMMSGMSIAVDDDSPLGNGEWKERTIWLWVEAWNKLAERVSTFEKGDEVLVFGKLKQSMLTVGGEDVVKTKVWADSVRLLRKAKAKPAGPGNAANMAQNAATEGEEDVPF